MDFAPCASYELLKKADESASVLGVPVKVGNILSTDTFYGEDPDDWKHWASYGVLAVEMETAALYTLAAQAGAKALTILTVSDDLTSGEATSSEDREKTFTDMVKIALETAVQIAK